jgi:hypothetical protein
MRRVALLMTEQNPAIEAAKKSATCAEWDVKRESPGPCRSPGCRAFVSVLVAASIGWWVCRRLRRYQRLSCDLHRFAAEVCHLSQHYCSQPASDL